MMHSPWIWSHAGQKCVTERREKQSEAAHGEKRKMKGGGCSEEVKGTECVRGDTWNTGSGELVLLRHSLWMRSKQTRVSPCDHFLYLKIICSPLTSPIYSYRAYLDWWHTNTGCGQWYISFLSLSALTELKATIDDFVAARATSYKY